VTNVTTMSLSGDEGSIVRACGRPLSDIVMSAQYRDACITSFAAIRMDVAGVGAATGCTEAVRQPVPISAVAVR
jgi:hypothetical protein